MIVWVLALLLLAPLSAKPQQASGDTRQRTALEDLERHWLAAVNDPDALESILADDFVHVLPAGLITKREQIDFLRQHPVPPDGTSKRLEHLQIRVFGAAGVVTGIVVATTTGGTERRTLFTDVFALRDGRWRAVNAQETPMDAAARPR